MEVQGDGSRRGKHISGWDGISVTLRCAISATPMPKPLSFQEKCCWRWLLKMKISFLLTKLSCADSFPNKTHYLIENVCGYPVPDVFAVATRSFMSHAGHAGCFKKVKIRSLRGGRGGKSSSGMLRSQRRHRQSSSCQALLYFPKFR